MPTPSEVAKFSFKGSSENTHKVNEIIDTVISKCMKEIKSYIGPQSSSPETALTDYPATNVAKQLFPEAKFPEVKNAHLIELDRAIVGARNFLLSVYGLDSKGNVDEAIYEKFTQDQKPKFKTSKETFKEICEETREKFLNKNNLDEEKVKSMFYYILINDIGKVNVVAENVNKGKENPIKDHDEILADLLNRRDLRNEYCPNFENLSMGNRKDIQSTLNAHFSFAQFGQGENVPFSITKLLECDKDLIKRKTVEDFFDISGAKGAEKQQGSSLMIEPVAKSMMENMSFVAKYEFKNPSASSEDKAIELYKSFYLQKAKTLKLVTEQQGKLTENKLAATRLCLMLRINKPAEAKIVENSINNLEPKVKNNLTNELNKNGLRDSSIMLYYAPSVVQNTLSRLTTKEQPMNREDALKETIREVGPLFSKIFEAKRGVLNREYADKKDNTNMVIDLYKVSKHANSKDVSSFDIKSLEHSLETRISNPKTLTQLSAELRKGLKNIPLNPTLCCGRAGRM